MSVKSFLRATKRSLMGYPVFPLINAPFRALHTWRRYIGPLVKNWVVWIFTSREDINFTYALTKRCKVNLAASLASLLQKDYGEIAGYFSEIETDDDFNSHLRRLWLKDPERYQTDETPFVGRRMVWYAVARATKPKVLIETGVDQGMGAVVMCAALARNAVEGHPGKYYGTDINPEAGYYLQHQYANYGQILYGDSLKSLDGLLETVDLFINDSDHSEAYEQAEYELIKRKLSPNAILLGDNSHVTSKLAEFSMREGRRFVFLSEEPDRHWYRGAGVGVSLPKQYA
jgi:predicted O-methyltransferase YrrM